MYDWITASYNIEGHNHKDYTNKMVRLSGLSILDWHYLD